MFRNKKYFPLIIIFADILLIVFLGWLVIQISNLSDQNAVLKGQLDDIARQKIKLSSDKSESSRMETSLEILNKYFISSDEKVQLITTLEKLAVKSGIIYVLNNAIDGEQISLDTSIKGSYRDIYYFIKLLESSGYWVSFEKISLSRGTETRISNWSGSMVISIPNSDKQ